MLLGNSPLSLTHCPWITLKSHLSHRVQQGPGPPSTTTHHAPHLPPSLDLGVLQLLELQAFLSRAPKSLSPSAVVAPTQGVPAPTRHTLECGRARASTVGDLLPSLPVLPVTLHRWQLNTGTSGMKGG